MLVTPDGAELVTLNETGSAIWSTLVESQSSSSIADRLHEQLGTDRETLEHDAELFLGELLTATVVIAEDEA